MFETWDTQKRIDDAKRATKRVVDHTHYLLDIHESNAITLYSDTLSKQIPESYAANAFNVFQSAMHQIEIVRLCALWDHAHIDKETIPTIIELIDDQMVIDALADETRSHHANVQTPMSELNDINPEEQDIIARLIQRTHLEFGDQQAARAIDGLRKAIEQARKIHESPQLASIRNLRHKHLAHNLTQTAEEKKVGPIAPMKYGDEREVLNSSISIVEALYCWVNGTSLSFEDSRGIDRKYAEALWNACTFKIAR
jgi:hypothetical protein